MSKQKALMNNRTTISVVTLLNAGSLAASSLKVNTMTTVGAAGTLIWAPSSLSLSVWMRGCVCVCAHCIFISYSCQDLAYKNESWREKVSKHWNCWGKCKWCSPSIPGGCLLTSWQSAKNFWYIDVCQVLEWQNTTYSIPMPRHLV